MIFSALDTLVIGVFVIVAGLIIGYTLWAGISPMPSSAKARETMVNLVHEGSGQVIYELGSGWGGLAIALAKRFPNARVIGFEISPIPFLYSQAIKRLLGLRNLDFQRTDFMTAGLEDATVVCCYLYPDGMSKLAPKLNAELPVGAVVISNTFRLPGWAPTDVIELADIHRTHVYKYDSGRSLG